jgi:hypothetical protein
MPEFTIEIDTHEGATRSEQVLERLAELLIADEAVLGPAASLDARRGVVGATFQVEAKSFEQATHIAVEHFTAALLRSIPVAEANGEPSVGRMLIEWVTAREPAMA